ncbi:hypothetical protein [Aeromicrobium sp. CTD01-1L150]|uniref:hypothetical protein n=1 Tax=Aeromicrobium sp. CTD01-1L150 TaxID=3341830 RepID=UPI0035C16A12
MKRHLGALAAALLLLTACGGSDDPEPTQEPSPTQTSEPEPTSALPQGSGSGDVDLVVDDQSLVGDDWEPSCSESDGVIRFIANTPPLQTVQLELSADGDIEEFVASGEDFGPYGSDVNGLGDLTVEITDSAFVLSGSLEDGTSVAGALTCPE